MPLRSIHDLVTPYHLLHSLLHTSLKITVDVLYRPLSLLHETHVFIQIQTAARYKLIVF
jgi:hypothetical protein